MNINGLLNLIPSFLLPKRLVKTTPLTTEPKEKRGQESLSLFALAESSQALIPIKEQINEILKAHGFSMDMTDDSYEFLLAEIETDKMLNPKIVLSGKFDLDKFSSFFDAVYRVEQELKYKLCGTVLILDGEIYVGSEENSFLIERKEELLPLVNRYRELLPIKKDVDKIIEQYWPNKDIEAVLTHDYEKSDEEEIYLTLFGSFNIEKIHSYLSMKQEIEEKTGHKVYCSELIENDHVELSPIRVIRGR